MQAIVLRDLSVVAYLKYSCSSKYRSGMSIDPNTSKHTHAMMRNLQFKNVAM